MIEEDPHINYECIQACLGIGSSAANTILHDYLGARKVCSRWVPHSLSQDQKHKRVKFCKEMLERFEGGDSSRVYDILTGDEVWVYHYDAPTKRQSYVWLFDGEERPEVVRREKSVKKTMYAIFFSKSGLELAYPLEPGTTVTAEWYSKKCLPAVFESVKKRRPRTGLRGLLLHHDNASSHTAKVTKELLRTSNVNLLDHPPYSPDLAPCDFSLFPKMKEPLRGKRFESIEELTIEVQNSLNSFKIEDFHHCYKQWFHRMTKCISRGGGYIEGM